MGLPSRNPQHGVRWCATLATFASHALLFVVFAALCIGIARVLAATMQVAPLDVQTGAASTGKHTHLTGRPHLLYRLVRRTRASACSEGVGRPWPHPQHPAY